MNDDNRPLIIGAIAAVAVACMLAVVCVAASILFLGIGGISSSTTFALPQATPVPLTRQPTTNAVVDASADDDPSLGPDDAAVTIIAFSDFQCPFCKRFRDQTMDTLMAEYEGRLRFVYRDFPLTDIHPEAFDAALAAECADEQGQFWEMHDLLFENQDQFGLEPWERFAAQLQLDRDEFQTCFDSRAMQSEVEHDLEDGKRYGVTGTPTFFINGQMLVGAQPITSFESLIDQALNTGSAP